MLAILLHLLLASAVQMINYVVQRKAARSGFRDEMIRELAQMLFAIAAAERCFLRLRNNERANAPARFQHARALQFGIDFSHRVRIDAQIHRQLPHGRQLLTDTELAGSDCEPDRALKLSIERRRMIWVYVEHLAEFTIVLRQ